MPKDNTPFKVQIRKGFSDRNAIKPVNTKIQLGGLDRRTRISLLNAVNWLYDEAFHKISSVAVASGGTSTDFWVQVLRDVYGKPVSYSSSKGNDEVKMLKIVGNTVLHDDYDDVLTLIEYMAAQFAEKDRYLGSLHPYELFNTVFEKEYAGYRFVDGSIVQITDENEIREIEAAADTGFAAVDAHLKNAVGLLSNRNIPDYETSARESIAAAEEMCRWVAGTDAAGEVPAGGFVGAAPGEGVQLNETARPALAKDLPLREILQLLKNHPGVNPSFVSSFEALLGFVPLLTEDADVSFEEARYILVACSGFINYLKGVKSHER